jgi:hypothetical protein
MTTSKEVSAKIVDLRRSGVKNSPTLDKAVGVLERLRDAFVTIEKIERKSASMRQGVASLYR